MKKTGLFLLSALLILACRNKENKVEQTVPDTLAYTYDSVKVLSHYRPEKVLSTDTTKAVIAFPVFKDEVINQFIKRQVLNYFAQEEPLSSFNDIAASFIRGYDDFFRSTPGTFQIWYLDIRIEVLRQQPTYLSLKYRHNDFAGGAHGNSSVSFLNYNPTTHTVITLDSLIRPDKMKDLLALAETIFRKNENLNATEPLEEKYFFEKGKFTLAQSFHVNEKGLVFLYIPYEIKPYVEGYTELIIPLASLKTIAKPNTILTPTP
ncbi:hypothetical protein D9M68_496500 [compost metagenome]